MQQTFFIRPHNLNESVTKSLYKVRTVSERHSLYPKHTVKTTGPYYKWNGHNDLIECKMVGILFLMVMISSVLSGKEGEKLPEFVFFSETLRKAEMEIIKKRRFYIDLMPHLQGFLCLPAKLYVELHSIRC